MFSIVRDKNTKYINLVATNAYSLSINNQDIRLVI